MIKKRSCYTKIVFKTAVYTFLLNRDERSQTLQNPSTTPSKELKLWVHRPADPNGKNQRIERQEQEKEPSVNLFMDNHLLSEIQ